MRSWTSSASRTLRDALGRILAHGQKQWLEIGMLLMQNPELLLVDEPVAGMTPHEIERTAELLLSLAGEHSVVVVEHDMAFVRSIARRVTVLHEGHVIAEGDMDKVQNDPRVREVYLGSVSVLDSQSPQPVLRRQPHVVGRGSCRPRRFAHVPDGPQRHGQDDASQMHHGSAGGEFRRHHIRRQRVDQAAPPSSGQGSASGMCRRGAKFSRI